MKESKAMVKKEVSFMKKKGAPKSMIKHEMKEAGMKKMAAGGLAAGHKAADGIAKKGKTKGKEVKMALGGAALGALSRAAQQRGANLAKSPQVSRPPTSPKPPQMGGGLKQIVPSKMAQQQLAAKHTAQVQALSPAQRAQYDAQKARAFSDMQKQKAGVMGIGSQMAKNPQMDASKMGNARKAMAGLGAAVAGKMMGKKAGGLAAGHKEADGIAKKGKTKAMQVKMAGGGKTKKYC